MPSTIKEIVDFEKNVKSVSASSNTNVEAKICNNDLILRINNCDYSTRINKQIIHQLGSRIWNQNNDYSIICNNWGSSLKKSKEFLESLIVKAIKDFNLIIKYSAFDSGNEIYGIVSNYFKEINLMEFREILLKTMKLSENIERIDTNNSSTDKHSEYFRLKSQNSQTKFELKVHYPKNNGYDSFNLDWFREILVCSNGMTRIEFSQNHKLKHFGNINIPEFIQNSIREGIENHIKTESQIKVAQEKQLQKELFSEFYNRIHLANISKPRIIDRLKTEISATGNTEWSLSQSLTWLGTHEKALANQPKKYLIEAGSQIVEQGLENYINNPESVYKLSDIFYGALLPENFSNN